MADIFPERRFHLGTDEVFWRCYNTSSAVRAAVLAAGKSLDDDGLKWVVRQFIQRAQTTLERLGKSSVVWNEGFDTYGPGNFGWAIAGPTGRTYSINSELAAGGMAQIYDAIQVSLNRPVAIKFLDKQLLSHIEANELFERESLIIAQLNHPNIVQVIDKGISDEVPEIKALHPIWNTIHIRIPIIRI